MLFLLSSPVKVLSVFHTLMVIFSVPANCDKLTSTIFRKKQMSLNQGLLVVTFNSRHHDLLNRYGVSVS